MSASARGVSVGPTKYVWATTGDINAFFGLMLDNVVNLAVLAGILVAGFYQNYSDIQPNASVPAETFARTVPAGARLVASLPGMEDLTQIASASEGWGNAPDFTVKTVEGKSLTLSKLKGKVILLNFYFNH